MVLTIQYLEAACIFDEHIEGLVGLGVLGLAPDQPAGDRFQGLGLNAAVGREGVGKARVWGLLSVTYCAALALVGLDVLEREAAQALVVNEGGGFVRGSVAVDQCHELVGRVVLKTKGF